MCEKAASIQTTFERHSERLENYYLRLFKKLEECLFSWKHSKEIWLNTFAKYYEFTYNRSNSFQTEIILWLPFKILITFTSSERWT